MRNRTLPPFVLCLIVLPLLAGCVAPDETPDAERAAAKKTVEKANSAAGDAQQRVNEGNAVLDGK